MWSEERRRPGCDPTAAMVICEELQGADAPMYGTAVSLMVAKVLLDHGTDEMRREIVPEVLRGEIDHACSASASPRPAPTSPTPRPGPCETATSG